MNKLNNGHLSKAEIVQRASLAGKKGSAKSNRIRHRLTVEMMNKHGTCPKQVEERFIKIMDELGHTPTFQELLEKDAALLAVLYRRFKSYTNALTYFGLKGKRRADFGTYGMENIKLSIKQFVNQHKRLPSARDTKVGYLPDYMTVSKYFGTWKLAKEYAFELLKKDYPEYAEAYDDRLNRIRIY